MIIEKEYYDNGNIEYVLYFNDTAELHREDGPAVIGYYINGNIRQKEYCINNSLHRINGPAFIYYSVNGRAEIEFWHKDIDYTDEIESWIKNNGFKKWEDMTEDDFDRMWIEVL